MKKLSLLSFLLIIISYTTSFAQDWKTQDICPVSIAAMHPDTTPGTNWTYPTIFNWYYETTGTPGVNSGTVGAMFFSNNYYLNRWSSTLIYRYNGGWGGPSSFLDSVSYVGSIRDLTTDGKYLYGGAAASTVYKLNADGSTAGTITLGSPAVARAIAYTPDEKGFYVCNFSDNIILCDATTGAVIRTLTGTSSIAGKYGMAYSNIPGDVPALWVWGQGTLADPYNILTKVNPTTGATIATYRFGPLPVISGATSPSGISGGAEVCVINDAYVLLLNYQNYALIGYKLASTVPVELTSFKANIVNKNVSLSWSTATEINNLGFEIQRKAGDNNWSVIAFRKGNGTTTNINNYSFIDNISGLDANKISYRLKQVDFNGQSQFSPVVLVDNIIPLNFNVSQNYPNPFNPSTLIKYQLPQNSFVSLKIYNSVGQEVAALVNGMVTAGIHEVQFNASNLSSGVYYYKIIAGENLVQTRKMVLMK
jgi:hypothetical protein